MAPRALLITEEDLLEVMTQRSHLEKLRKEAREAEAKLELMEAQVMDMLRLGARVEGYRTATIAKAMGPCIPKYKELWVAHLAEYHGMTEGLAEQMAREKYPPKEVERLVIGEALPGILTKPRGVA